MTDEDAFHLNAVDRNQEWILIFTCKVHHVKKCAETAFYGLHLFCKRLLELNTKIQDPSLQKFITVGVRVMIRHYS